MIIFRWIYRRNTTYPGFSPAGSYPHFFEGRFVWDYLTNSTTISKIIPDWFRRGRKSFAIFLIASSNTQSIKINQSIFSMKYWGFDKLGRLPLNCSKCMSINKLYN